MKAITYFKNTAKITPVLLILMTLAGCYAGSSLKNIPENSDTIIRVNDANKSKLPGFISSINVKNNDAGANVNEGFERRVLGHLQQSNYFTDVIYGIYSKRPEPPYIDLRLDVDENVDLNNGANMAKAFFTGFTMFLLAPALPITFDFDSNFNLTAMLSNGAHREYKASCGASGYGTFPYASASVEFKKSMGIAIEKCLNSVINQLTADKAL